MKICWTLLMAMLACFHRDGSDALPAQIPQGPEGPAVQPAVASEPRPPSIDLLDLKAPAPPPDSNENPRPPAPPDQHILDLFNKDPGSFPAAFAELQTTENKKVATRAAPVKQQRSPTYDQFITAGVITGLNLQQRSAYTMFAPADSFLRSNNISLPIMALKDMECVRRIVRAHTVLGRLTLSQGIEDVALSLSDTPIFFNSRQVNGVDIVRSNIEADYGLVHLINGWMMDKEKLTDSCPSVRSPPTEGQQELLTASSSNLKEHISLLLKPDEGIHPAGSSNHQDSSVKANEINDLLDDDDPLAVVVPFDADPDDSSMSSEANVDTLLSSIDNFASAWSMMADQEDSVISTLQGLGTSTFLALLERSDLMEMLTNDGPWTVFAPHNSAWQALPPASFDHIMKDRVLLKQILSYHISPTNATRSSLSNGRKLPSFHEGLPIHVNLYSDGWASWYAASGSMITNLDELAGNGVVHVVQSVLFPPLGDLSSTVKWTPALATAFEWLQASNFTDDDLGESTVTAFLPESSPFLDASVASLNPSQLSDLWRRHLVRGTWFSSGLINGDRLETIGGDVLIISHNPDCFSVNGACIIVRDITLTNGVLHVMDKLV